MSNQSAWSTEFFDDRSLHYKAQETAPAAAHIEIPVAIPPPMYTTSGKISGSGSISNVNMFVCTFLVPRVLQVLFLIIALSVTAAIEENGFSFTQLTSLKFLLSMEVIVLVYTLAQLGWVLFALVSGKSHLTAGGSLAAYATWICDQVLAYTLLAACAAGATIVVAVEGGEIGDSCSDSGLTTACTKAQAAVAMAFLAFLTLAASAAISSQLRQLRA